MTTLRGNDRLFNDRGEYVGVVTALNVERMMDGLPSYKVEMRREPLVMNYPHMIHAQGCNGPRDHDRGLVAHGLLTDISVAYYQDRIAEEFGLTGLSTKKKEQQSMFDIKVIETLNGWFVQVFAEVNNESVIVREKMVDESEVDITVGPTMAIKQVREMVAEELAAGLRSLFDVG